MCKHPLILSFLFLCSPHVIAALPAEPMNTQVQAVRVNPPRKAQDQNEKPSDKQRAIQTLASNDLRYTMKDLEVLRQEQDYAEFFLHAKDIRPSQRNEVWKKMVEEMGVNWARKLKAHATIGSKDFQYMEEIFALTPLEFSETYKSLRAELGLKYFKKSLSQAAMKDKTAIFNQMKDFWLKDTFHHETGLALMKMTLEDGQHISSAWFFASIPMKSAQSGFYCKREALKPVILRKIVDTLNQTILPVRQAVQGIIHDDCWEAVKPMARNFYDQLSQSDKGAFYTLLRDEDLISAEEKDFYSFAYLMDSPAQGPVMNESWNIINTLKDESKRREALLSKLEDRSVLPDGIFGSYDLEKKKIIVNFISKVFPEYFDFYARTCIQYLKGEVKYEGGNPTLHCKELFQMVEKNPNLVNPVLQIQYKKAL